MVTIIDVNVNNLISPLLNFVSLMSSSKSMKLRLFWGIIHSCTASNSYHCHLISLYLFLYSYICLLFLYLILYSYIFSYKLIVDLIFLYVFLYFQYILIWNLIFLHFDKKIFFLLGLALYSWGECIMAKEYVREQKSDLGNNSAQSSYITFHVNFLYFIFFI